MMTATGIEFISDFIRRTRSNYDKLSGGEYEVTQLINSAIGLLIIPKESKDIKISDDFIDSALFEEIKKGIKNNTYVENKNDPITLQQIVKHLRNGIAHGRFQFEAEKVSDDAKNILIHSVVFEDSSRASNKKPHEDFKIEISVELLRNFFIAFSDAVANYVDNEVARQTQQKTKKRKAK